MPTQTVRTQRLEADALDWAVAKAKSAVFALVFGYGTVKGDGIWINERPHVLRKTWMELYKRCSHSAPFDSSVQVWTPSRNGSQAQPLIESEKIAIEWRVTDSEGEGYWQAQCLLTGTYGFIGKTALEAAMRCYVAIKLGDSVEIPDHLQGE